MSARSASGGEATARRRATAVRGAPGRWLAPPVRVKTCKLPNASGMTSRLRHLEAAGSETCYATKSSTRRNEALATQGAPGGGQSGREVERAQGSRSSSSYRCSPPRCSPTSSARSCSARHADPHRAAVALVILGWAFAREIGRGLGARALQAGRPGDRGNDRLPDPARDDRCRPHRGAADRGPGRATLAVGGAVTAVVLGLAAQQTVGNLFAGTVLLSARPFRVGDRVRLQGGAIAGQIEGVVSSLGLLYTTLASGEDRSWSRTAWCSTWRSRRCASPTPSTCSHGCRPTSGRARSRSARRAVQDAMRGPRIELEELDGDEVVVRISATPEDDRRGRAARRRDPRRPSPRSAARGRRTDRRRHPSTGRRTGALRRDWPRAWPRRTSRAAEAALASRVGQSSGARPREGRRRRAGASSGATSISARSRSIARRRPRDVLGRLGARRTRGSLTPASWNMPAVADEAGEHDRDADAAVAQVLAQRVREAAQAELRRRVDRAAAAGDLARQRGDEHHVPAAARGHRLGQPPRHHHRRAQVDGERAVDVLDREARDVPAARQRRRWPPARRRRPPRRAGGRRRRASARSHAIARPPVSAASGSSTSARRPVEDGDGAARGERAGDRRARGRRWRP